MPIKNHQVSVSLSKDIQQSRREIISLKSKALMKRSWSEIGADWLADRFGTVAFLSLNIIWFAVWLIWNLGLFKNVSPFDPFPFSLLTTIVSLEAIFLSIIVLISQNRAAKIDQLRQEIDLQLDVISEQEITKIMEMLAKIMKSHNLDISSDSVLHEMLKPTDTEKIEKELQKQM